MAASLPVRMAVCPLMGIAVRSSQNIAPALVSTAVSIARGCPVRGHFNDRHGRGGG